MLGRDGGRSLQSGDRGRRRHGDITRGRALAESGSTEHVGIVGRRSADSAQAVVGIATSVYDKLRLAVSVRWTGCHNGGLLGSYHARSRQRGGWRSPESRP